MNPKAMNNKWRILAHAAVCCLLLIATLRCEAQGNLVPNPSFELLTDTCPCNIGFQGTAKPLYWEKWNQSPEYFNACVDQTCTIDTLIDVPQNGFGFQHALDGDAYVGMYAYGYVSWLPDNNYREYVGCQLLEPLEVGVIYELSFHTNAAIGQDYWPMQWSCNNMGMLFTMLPNIWTDVDQPPFLVHNYAHLHSATVISDTADWTMVSGSFVADSAYPYLVLGNFFSNALTDTIHLGEGTSLGAYYFVDAVCVVKAGQQCDGAEGIEDQPGGQILAGPNPAFEVLTVAGMTIGDSWRVLDPTGRILRSGTALGGLLEIHVSDWAPGEYVLHIGAAGGRVRFVVMR